jgi:hypothetical protein
VNIFREVQMNMTIDIMKSQLMVRPMALAACLTLITQCAITGTAQTTSPVASNPPATLETAPPGQVQANTVPLSPGVSEVLKLAHAQIDAETVVAYIKNSGASYALSASEIVYLHQEGVPDRAIAAMLAQAKKPALDASPATPAPSVATAAAPPPAPNPAMPAPATATAAAQAAPAATTYVQAAPTYVPASTVYVAPYPTTYAYYDDYWPYYYGRPYYGPYWGYPRGSVSFSIGIGGHGGGFRGGGFHGGHR